MKRKTKTSFSKLLIIFETVLVTIVTVGGFWLAYKCIEASFDGSLPWIVSMVVPAWGAYGFSAKHYYAKAMAENTKGGITYDSAMKTYLKIEEEM